MGATLPILSILVWLPIVAGVAVLAFGSGEGARHGKRLALGASALTFVFSIPLMTGFDPSTLRVVATVPQAQVAAIQAGGKARIEIPSLGRWVDVKAMTIVPQADPRTHTTRIRLELPPDVPYAFVGLPQYETERLLAEHLQRLGGRVERGVELRSLEQDGEGVTAVLAGPSGDETVRWRIVGDSLALALGGEWVNYRLKVKGKRLTLSGGDLTEPVTFDLVGPPTPRPDTVPIPPDPDLESP